MVKSDVQETRFEKSHFPLGVAFFVVEIGLKVLKDFFCIKYAAVRLLYL